MNYGLAKQLKEAGFPQGRYAVNTSRYYLGNFKVGSDIINRIIYGNSEMVIDYQKELVYIPTLSELIEACGTAFSELNKMTHTREPQKWAATSFPCEECEIVKMNQEYGSTPEEAVANLWLKLNPPAAAEK